jgi:hypothetical protein
MLVVGLVGPACAKKIGDACSTNIDCAQDGMRICDLSQPGGYCTMDGCDEISCPSEAICVRFFDQRFATKHCDNSVPGTVGECSSGDGHDELCVVCGGTTAQPAFNCCVPSASERRYCADKCGGNGDCRGGYTCRTAGTNGSIALLADPAASATAKFCGPGAP